MRNFSPRSDILPPGQKRLWQELRPAQGIGFVLYGGTAIALHFGHRQSVDFDFFTDRPLDKDEIRRVMPFAGSTGVVVLQDQPNTYVILTAGDGVKVSFFGGLEFGRVGEPELTNDGVLQVASREDLLATKLKVILDRVEAKDYRDIAALISAGTSLEIGLSGATALFGPFYPPAEALKALVHFKGGDLETLSPPERRILIETVSSVRNLPTVFTVSKQLSA
ncbi:MAG TPA: nucleotidyl transferase AbiEii/AbiGii toxin family protein [Opitutaceae bacterium]|nr:nucleotidyl transferase AbiEii/AbiGii toxin family protein [Opitutaceae bacterium]